MSSSCYINLLLSSVCNKCGNENKEIFMEQESIEILEILSLTDDTEKY